MRAGTLAEPFRYATLVSLALGAGVGCAPGPGDAGLGRGVEAPSADVSRPAERRGRLDPRVIQAIVRGNFSTFRDCYDDGLRRDPSLRGRVVMHFEIGSEGHVTEAGAGGDLPDPAVVKCLIAAVHSLSFPPPKGGVVTVSYPIVFGPRRREDPRKEAEAWHFERAGVALGEVTLDGPGRTSVALVEQAAQARIDTLRHCYAQALVEAPSLRTQVTVRFVIHDDGRTSIDEVIQLPLDAMLANCVARTFTSAAFEPPDGGPVTVTLPLTLSPRASSSLRR